MKVFISYGKEDIETAKKLRDDLEKAGIKTWLDEEDLLPGQNWKKIISREIKESSYFLALLSSESLSTRGFVQKELKMALDLLDEFPEDEIFVIPVRIDECEPSDEQLKEIHCADLFPSYEKGVQYILRVLSKDRQDDNVRGSLPKKKKPLRKERLIKKSLTNENQQDVEHLKEKASRKNKHKRNEGDSEKNIQNIIEEKPPKHITITPVVNYKKNEGIFVLLILLMILCGIGYYVSKKNQHEKQILETPASDITNSFGMKFIYIPPGTFIMGSPSDESDSKVKDETQHNVKLENGFYIQTTEVTQGQWKAVMKEYPPGLYFNKCGDNCPVERVSWYDVDNFIKKLNEEEKSDKYRLPTEAEWEYAARAGTTTAYNWGNSADCSKANYGSAGECKGINPGKTIKVASYPPNDCGLYDMHGNVWEWCSDWYNKYPGDKTTDGSKVIRGGSWTDNAIKCRSANRHSITPDIMNPNTGFRLVRSQ